MQAGRLRPRTRAGRDYVDTMFGRKRGNVTMTEDKMVAAIRRIENEADAKEAATGSDLCPHIRVTTFRSEDRSVRMWACEDCRRRFYPACPVCVDVGHRNIVPREEAHRAG